MLRTLVNMCKFIKIKTYIRILANWEHSTFFYMQSFLWSNTIVVATSVYFACLWKISITLHTMTTNYLTTYLLYNMYGTINIMQNTYGIWQKWCKHIAMETKLWYGTYKIISDFKHIPVCLYQWMWMCQIVKHSYW